MFYCWFAVHIITCLPKSKTYARVSGTTSISTWVLVNVQSHCSVVLQHLFVNS